MFTSQFNTLSGVSYCEYKLCVMFSWVISLTVATSHCYWSRAQWQDSELCSQKGIYIQHQWNIYIYRATVFWGFQERVRETHVKHLFVESRTWYTHRPIQHRDPLSFWSGPGQSIQVDGHRGQKKHQGPQGSTNASQATLTEVSTTIQWGTLLQHGLKYCQDPSAMMSRRCVCTGVRIRRTQKNRRLPGEHSKNSMPGQPLMNHDSTNTVVGKVCLTHMCDPLICYRNVYIYLYICYWCWNIDRFTMILLETKKGI